MYDNIGAKIKAFVKGLVIVISVLFVIYGIILIFKEESKTDDRIYGLLIAIVGPIFSWISGFLIYGFGELVEKTCSIEEILKNTTKNSRNELNEILENQMEEEYEESNFEEENTYNPCEEQIEKTEESYRGKKTGNIIKNMINNFRF